VAVSQQKQGVDFALPTGCTDPKIRSNPNDVITGHREFLTKSDLLQ
jgi:hypothetical protein